MTSIILNTLIADDLVSFLHDRAIELQIKKEGVWLCGGAVRNLIEGDKPRNDYDVFFKDDSFRAEFINHIVSNGATAVRDVELNTTYEYFGMKVQAIKLNYGSIEEVLRSFDFTITQFGYDGEYLHTTERALYDLGRRRLVVNRVTYAVSSVRRLLMYESYVFTAFSGTIAELLKQVIDNPESLDDRIISLD